MDDKTFNENISKIYEKLSDINKNMVSILEILRGMQQGGVALPEYEEPMVEETPVKEVQEVEQEANDWIENEANEFRIKPKYSFEMKLRIADDDVKAFYTDIKNDLLSYGLHDRISRFRENFNKGRLQIARMAINGKTLKVYLAIDPESLDAAYYHHTDVSGRKGAVDLPTMINVRSKVAARKVKELISIICENLIIKRKKYEYYDFAQDLTVDGFTTVECKGYDYMVKDSYTRQEAEALPSQFAAQLIEPVEDEVYQYRFIKTTVDLDTLSENFEDGDVVDIAAIREKGLGVENTNYLIVKDSESISKKFKVFANEYTPNAVKMICLSGGEAYMVIQPEEPVE